MAVRWVVAGRLLLLLVAAAALASAVALARGRDRALDGAVVRYVCPMHPAVTSAAPGDCPICGMALVPVAGSADAGTREAESAAHVGRAERRTVAEQVRAPAWLGVDGVGTAVLHQDDLVGLGPDEDALFFGSAAPAMGIAVHLSPELPVAVDASTSKVRFRVDRDGDGPSRAGTARDVGTLRIAIRARELLVVPSSAVLYSAQGPYVLAAPDDGGTFEERPVAIGRILDSGYVGGRIGEEGAIVVLSGLREGERVVTGYAFFAEAERRLRAARGSEEAAP